MAVFVGIDEAGFGPILGPLVVSAAAFSLPKELVNSDLWSILQKSCANKKKHLAGRLLITDSKKAFIRSQGIKHLERTILACLKCLGKNPSTLVELVEVLCPEAAVGLKAYPWYKDAPSYRLKVDHNDIAIASGVLTRDLAANNMRLVQILSQCIDVTYYNQMVTNVKNKASVLFAVTSRLIYSAFKKFGDNDLQIIIDRQGGRVRYRKPLLRALEGMELTILHETQQHSSYELRDGRKRMRVHFIVGADDHFLPVSLASMASKYIRELLIDNINRYFAKHCANLRPTAGYWKDGLRFINDIKKSVPQIQFDNNQLIRCR